jgi:hypothetical protein
VNEMAIDIGIVCAISVNCAKLVAKTLALCDSGFVSVESGVAEQPRSLEKAKVRFFAF